MRQELPHFNPIPARTAEYLHLFSERGYQLRDLKTQLERSGHLGKVTANSQAVYRAVSEVLSDEVIAIIAAERSQVRFLLENELMYRIREDSLPWLKAEGNTPLLYSIIVEARSQREMEGRVKDAQHRGFKKVSVPVAAITLDTFREHMDKILLSDSRLESGTIASQLEDIIRSRHSIPAQDQIYLLSVVHSVVPAASTRGYEPWTSGLFETSQGFLREDYLQSKECTGLPDLSSRVKEQYQRVQGANRIDFRIKSGAEHLYKEVELLTGIATRSGRSQGGKRTEIADYIAQRLRCEDAQLISEFRRFYDQYGRNHPTYAEDAIGLQNISKQEFLAQLPAGEQSFYRGISREIERKSVIVNGQPVLPKYVTAALAICGDNHASSASSEHESGGNNVYCMNQLETQLFGHNMFNWIEGHNGRDHLSYKARADELRVDRFSPLEWAVAVRLAGTYPHFDRQYLANLFEARPAAGYLPFSPLRDSQSSNRQPHRSQQLAVR